jgi:hypothetical protein
MTKNKRGKKKEKLDQANVDWNRRALALALILAVGVILLILGKRDGTISTGAEVKPTPQRTSRSVARTQVPPFHEDVNEATPFPETLSPSLFDNPVISQAYQVAGEIPEVLVQQPCYCFCQGHGHGSLLDCYTDYHGAG